ncbi:class II aldolase/adducin family protein [Amycolatopsis rubida]|uniref:Class II aldolase/adducin family protein n=1 Tax=Amycolatopsis rubida TaxID=112413 RepID=A0A1I5EDG8_9PSEU|nr:MULTISPECIES: class II aldolase/adducin family protein [Amycolatopsis]MYW97213.1 class II aldolase/adducin family protein [Amycolatopsis rubida]NEC62198.1 class II aldolase/adducin family protein [Amycolatopsis rubida]OAP24645.1 Decarboxylase NovR [Amycolatopsis sp. M39]SFO09569.1 Ribulose-5-phosphate 4-epimerase/Fuculose-1-phosphate aldolase [Amycolatopsis rubida]
MTDAPVAELDLDTLPEHLESAAAERAHRKRQLAVAFRLFARYGFDEGIAGHLTARDPEFPNRFWVNPYAVHFSRIKVSDLLLLDENGKVVEGTRRTNKAAFAIHSTIHEAREDVVAVAHAHTIHGRAWSALNRVLDPIVQESCAFYENHVLFDEYKGLVLERDEGVRIAARLGSKRAAILRHHGLLTVGRSVGEAAWWFITMERACQMQLLAEAAGTPRVMTAEEAALAARQFGSANMARNNFRLLEDLIVEQEPDVLD